VIEVRALDAALHPRSRLDAQSLDAVHIEVLRLFDAHAAGLRRFVRGCGAPPETADDIVQETFVALFQHLMRGGQTEHLRGWLFRVSYRLTLKARRRSRRTALWQVGWPAQVEEIAASHGDPEAGALHRERCRSVLAVLAALPERDRHCFYLRAQGLRYRQIAATLGMSLGAVAKALARGMGKLAIVLRRTDVLADARD